MILDKPHAFAKAEALSRMQALTTYWSSKYGVRINWRDQAAEIDGKVKGIKFSGTLRVEDRRVHADIKVGFLAETLGARAYVEHKVDDYLNPQTPLSSLAVG